MGFAKRYDTLQQEILKILDKPMSTSDITRKVLNNYSYIHWKTVKTRLDNLETQGKIQKVKIGYTIIWNKI